MIRRRYLGRTTFASPTAAEVQEPNVEVLHRRLSERVVERFSLACGAVAVVADVSPPALERDEEPPPNPGHPLCADYARSDYCRESWQLHLAELTQCPETHWHKCDHGLYCAVVPVVCNSRCSAVVKLVCPPAESRQKFENLVAVLDIMVKDFVVSEADFLRRLPCTATAEARTVRSPTSEKAIERQPTHPIVVRALRYVEENFSSPELTVTRIASELDVAPSYLSHIFVSEVGERLGRFITRRRIELAKTLLEKTDLQIKRIAADTGHANPQWFCHVFQRYASMTPVAYRERACSRPGHASEPQSCVKPTRLGLARSS
jgi:AraC-like DNA-binding protein